MGITSAIEELENEREIKRNELTRINKALQVLSDRVPKVPGQPRKSHQLSAATINKIREAQLKRWAAIRAIKKKTPTKKGS